MSKSFFTFIFLLYFVFPAFALDIRLTPIAKGFKSPVYLTANTKDEDIFIVEQRGTIQRIKNNQTSLFLDIRKKVSSGGEKGLLSMAFHPDYPENNRFFVYYTALKGGFMSGQLFSRVSEFKVKCSASKTCQALPQSERIILEIPQPYSNHNGGQIAFGKDGFMYIGMGDGGSGGDPRGHGQNTQTLLGAILRIDINKKPYGLPPDNPFIKNKQARDEIWAYGLRNPWRFSFDRQTGQLFAGDVGQNKYEEVHIITKGGNYGWNIMEGKHCYMPSRNCKKQGLIQPIIEYDHSQGKSITGGFVYRGKKFPQMQGVYFYADFVKGVIWGFKPGKWNKRLLETQYNFSSFGEDSQGELYVLDWGRGQIFRVEAK